MTSEIRAPFQEACMRKAVKILEEAGLPARFERVDGEHEAYYRVAGTVGTQTMEVYVYRDEAGFMVNGQEWTICERPDYDGDDALIEAFLEKLQGRIQKLKGVASSG